MNYPITYFCLPQWAEFLRCRAMEKSTDINPKLIHNFMDNLNMSNFIIVGIDTQGNKLVSFRTTSEAGDRALRGFVEDWSDEQAELFASGTPNGEQK